jgi:hypothetical protein
MLKLAVNLKTNVTQINGLNFIPGQTPPLLVSFVDKEEALKMLAMPHYIGQRRLPFQYHEFQTTEDLQNFVNSKISQTPQEENSPATSGKATSNHQPTPTETQKNSRQPPTSGSGFHSQPLNTDQQQQPANRPTISLVQNSIPNQGQLNPVHAGEQKFSEGGQNYRQDPQVAGPGPRTNKQNPSEQEHMPYAGAVPNRAPMFKGPAPQDPNAPNSHKVVSKQLEHNSNQGSANQKARQPEPISKSSRIEPQYDERFRPSLECNQDQFYQSDWPHDNNQQEGFGQSYQPMNQLEENQSQHSSDQFYPDQEQLRFSEKSRSKLQHGQFLDPEQDYTGSGDMSFSSQQRIMNRGPVDHQPRYNQLHYSAADSQEKSFRYPNGAEDSSESSRVGSEDLISQSINSSRKPSAACKPGDNAYLEGSLAQSNGYTQPQGSRNTSHQAEDNMMEASGSQFSAQSSMNESQAMRRDSTTGLVTKKSVQQQNQSSGSCVVPSTLKANGRQPNQPSEQENTGVTNSSLKGKKPENLDADHFPSIITIQTQGQSHPNKKVEGSNLRKQEVQPTKFYEPRFSLIKPSNNLCQPVDPPILELHPLGALNEALQTEETLLAEAALQGKNFKPYMKLLHNANTYYLNPGTRKHSWGILGGNIDFLRTEIAYREARKMLAKQSQLTEADPAVCQLRLEDVDRIFEEFERQKHERRRAARMHHEQLRMQTQNFLGESDIYQRKPFTGASCIAKPQISKRDAISEGENSRDGKTNSTTNSQTESREQALGFKNF